MKNVIFISLIVLLASCEKDKDKLQSGDYLIFGDFYGECGGESCIDIYKLGDNKLYEDVNDNYPSGYSFYNGNFSRQLSEQKYNETKDLIDYFPAALLSETDTVIGQPDAGDWGGYYVEYKFNGTRKFWLLDKATGNVPTEYHNFISKMEEKLQNLN